MPSVRSRFVTREGAVEVAQVESVGQCRELVHDYLRLGLRDGARHLFGVERIRDHGCGAEGGDGVTLRFAARHAYHLVSPRDQPRNELLSERSGCTCD